MPVQRTGASLQAGWRCGRRRWLAPVADLGVGPDNPVIPLCQDAQRMSFMLQYGLASGVDVVKWADSQIIALDSPPGTLIDLSMTPPGQTADLLSHLRALASGADIWAAFRAVLGLLHDYVVSRPSQAEHVANELLRTAAWIDSEGMPEDLRFLYHFDDAFFLARDGSFGRTEDVLQDFLRDLARFRKQVQP